MSDGYCLKWTSWRVWLHPNRASRRLAAAAKIESDLKSRLDETLKLLEQQRKETSIQTFQASEFSRRLAEIEKRLIDEHRELEDTKHELTKARDLIDEHKTVDEKLMEFDHQLAKIEDMKRNYEKRIASLKSRLADARKRLAVVDNNELEEKIDMSAADRIRAMYQKKPIRRPLSELKPVIPEPEVKNKPIEKTEPKAKKTKRLSDDWLGELPDF